MGTQENFKVQKNCANTGKCHHHFNFSSNFKCFICTSNFLFEIISFEKILSSLTDVCNTITCEQAPSEVGKKNSVSKSTMTLGYLTLNPTGACSQASNTMWIASVQTFCPVVTETCNDLCNGFLLNLISNPLLLPYCHFFTCGTGILSTHPRMTWLISAHDQYKLSVFLRVRNRICMQDRLVWAEWVPVNNYYYHYHLYLILY